MKTKSPPAGASSAFAWSILNTVISRLGTLGIGIVLARLLGPGSFGTFAVAMVALTAILSFNELGVSLAIVRWPGDPTKIVPTVNTISVLGSGLFCAGAVIAAPVFTALMGDPSATDVVRILILSVFVNGVVASPAALLQREFREKTRLGIDQANVWIGAVLSVVLAFAGMGAMALAVGRLAGSLVSGAMFLAASPVPYRFGLDRSQLGPLLRFGLPLAGTSVIFFGVGYADQLTAGAVLGSTALAFYVLAFNLSNWPVSILAQPLRRVAPAAFSALQLDRPGMNSAMTSIAAVLAAATLPLILFLAGGAVPLVDFVYGEAWLTAATAISWLVIAATCKVFCDLAYDYLVVLGRSGTVFTIQAGSLLILVPALVAGASWWGLGGLAAAQAAITGCVVLPLYLWQLRENGLAIKGMLAKIRFPLAAGLVTGVAARVLAMTVADHLVALFAAATIAVLVTAVLLFRLREQIRELQSIGRAATVEVPA
ncbi:MAG: oligosaccharide flippase family protein [Arthrobacter sp.]|nr:oligosaccharide flippase family protein [Arthrobacter sp.]